MSDSLIKDLSDGVLTLTLNRPDLHNAFDDDLIAALTEALLTGAEDDSLRAVVVTGAGQSFSAGADLQWMKRMADADSAENEADALRLANLMSHLNFMPVPTIARINGPAFGGGLGLIACCDITVAVDSATFGLTEARLGLTPAVISPYVFRRIGYTNARRYFLNAERFDAAEAQRIGLVQQVVPTGDLDDTIDEQIALIRATAPSASRVTKQLLVAISGENIERQARLDVHTAKLIAELRVGAEGQEGLAAFLEKRRPAWSERDDD